MEEETKGLTQLLSMAQGCTGAVLQTHKHKLSRVLHYVVVECTTKCVVKIANEGVGCPDSPRIQQSVVQGLY